MPDDGLKNLTKINLLVLQQILKEHVDTGNGYGFVNSDPGHPTYRIGAGGNLSSLGNTGPAKDTLFHLIADIEKEMKIRDIQPEHSFIASDWVSFCKYVSGVYDSRIKRRTE